MTRQIRLTGGEVTNVDDDVYDWASTYSWTIASHGYARSFSNGEGVYLHRLVAKAEKGQQVDHIDGDPLNNVRENLRICSQQENSRNRKGQRDGPKGASWSKHAKHWMSGIRHDGIRYHIGYFEHEEDAALAYDDAAQILYGEFARFNFPIAPYATVARDDTPYVLGDQCPTCGIGRHMYCAVLKRWTWASDVQVNEHGAGVSISWSCECGQPHAVQYANDAALIT